MKLNREQRQAIISRVIDVQKEKNNVITEEYKNSKEFNKGFKTFLEMKFPRVDEIIKILSEKELDGNFYYNGNRIPISKDSSIESIKNSYFDTIKYNIQNKLKLKVIDRQHLDDFLIIKSIDNKDFNLEELVEELLKLK